jgi:broad specificity phosphatase PhoE
MTLPDRLTLVRHGESEANIAQRLRKAGREDEIPKSFADRHDSFMRLTPLGVEQARATGKWLAENAEIPFDRFYVSPHARTRETAAELRLGGEWFVDDRFRERDWGQVFSHEAMDVETRRIKSLHDYYWTPLGGESLATGLRLRVESIMNSLYRRSGVRHVLAVDHGETHRLFQVVNERLTPDAFLRYDNDPAYKVHNTMVLQYSCVNPLNPEERSNHYRWRRAICPWDRSLDWDNGEWVDVNAVRHSDDDLLNYAHEIPRLLDESDLA